MQHIPDVLSRYPIPCPKEQSNPRVQVGEVDLGEEGDWELQEEESPWVCEKMRLSDDTVELSWVSWLDETAGVGSSG